MEYIITYDNKDYEVKEPTIQTWQKINLSKEFKSESDFFLDLISYSTGLEAEELKDVDQYQIFNVIYGLSEYYTKLDTKFYNKFTFKGVDYYFTDFNNMTFGHFVDIDTYCSKDENYRTQNINYFLALLYTPKGEKYHVNLREREELFKELPIKYFLGSQRFFFLLEQTLVRNMKHFSFRLWILTKRVRLNKRFNRFMGGIRRYLHSLRMMLPKLKR